MMRMLYPGSFDPVTRGHMDIIRRAARLCDELIVAVMHNPDKRGALAVDMRVALLKKACAELSNVRVIAHGGLLVSCAKEQEASCVVRGVRPLGDFETEYGMAPLLDARFEAFDLRKYGETEITFVRSADREETP